MLTSKRRNFLSKINNPVNSVEQLLRALNNREKVQMNLYYENLDEEIWQIASRPLSSFILERNEILVIFSMKELLDLIFCFNDIWFYETDFSSPKVNYIEFYLEEQYIHGQRVSWYMSSFNFHIYLEDSCAARELERRNNL